MPLVYQPSSVAPNADTHWAFLPTVYPEAAEEKLEAEALVVGSEDATFRCQGLITDVMS